MTLNQATSVCKGWAVDRLVCRACRGAAGGIRINLLVLFISAHTGIIRRVLSKRLDSVQNN